MTLTTTDPFAAVCQELEGKQTQDLKRELLKAIDITVSMLIKAAAIVRVLEERGEDLSEFKFGLMSHLRRIAYGQLLPEVVAKCLGHSSLRFIAGLPIPDQRRCISDHGVEIGVLRDGVVERLTKPLLSLDPPELKQVFALDHIRTPDEQVAWLRSQSLRKETQRLKAEPSPWTISGKTILVSRPMTLSRKDLEQMLAAITTTRTAVKS
jgi:hypothetical protein